jgi:hypothetical protein
VHDFLIFVQFAHIFEGLIKVPMAKHKGNILLQAKRKKNSFSCLISHKDGECKAEKTYLCGG